ncbi:hypothetical protein [Xanthomonas arboricola]|uniref:CRISPR-associated protein Cas2 n=1 Tax=Xanthomonas arboricola TaxID=56448 RepID=A0AAU9I6P7_9XANT|nr:hypothetical protein [Xanthomonas arboricola]CAE6836386.1 hypothetical protein XA1314C_37120 [Xanthomonas arboricola]CAE6836406.1 hypothetical protein XA1314C_37120 [Xanthomonas arboricola]
MSGFIVSYDLYAQGQNYPCITEKLKAMGAWHMQQSVWIVSTNQSSAQLRDHLKPCLDANDKLFVGKLSEAAWQGYSNEVGVWLKQVII